MTPRNLACLAFAAALSLPSFSHAAIKGDVNLDGQVDSADYSVLNQALGLTYTLAWNQRDAADVAPIGTNDLIGDGIVDSADALVFDQALQGNDVDGDGLNPAAEIGGTGPTNGSPFLRDTDGDGAPDNADSTRGGFNANGPPSAPTVAITGATGTSLTGTVSACSNPDGVPYPNSCSQEVRVVAAGGSCDASAIVAPVVPSSGTWTVNGLAAGVVYTTYGRSSDGSLVACSSAQTSATTPTANAPVVPQLNALAATTTSNPITLTGFAAPGQEIRVFVNGVEQDYVRAFVTGNAAFPTNPFIVATDGTFSVPVVLDDLVNNVSVAALGSASAESGRSNQVATSYENAITRNPIGLPLVNEGGTNKRVVTAGQIVVLTNGASPGLSGDYTTDVHLDVKENALLVVQPGATVSFQFDASLKRKLIVGGTLRVRGREDAETNLQSTQSTWRGIEIESTARQISIDHARVASALNPIVLNGTTTSRPDLTVSHSRFPNTVASSTYTIVQATTGGAIVLRESTFEREATNQPCTGAAAVLSDVTSAELRWNSVRHRSQGFSVTDSPAIIDANIFETLACSSNDPVVSNAISIVRGPSSTVVSNNWITDQWLSFTSAGHWGRGILIEDASPTVENNRIESFVQGIVVAKVGSTTPQPTVTGNRIRDFWNLTGSQTHDGTGWGIRLTGGAGATISNNSIDDNQSPSTPLWNRAILVSVAGSAPVEISGNRIARLAFGIQIMNGASVPTGENVSIHHNSLDDILHTGIYLERSNATIEDNTLLDSGTASTSETYNGGINVVGSSPLIQRNRIRGSYIGIRVSGGAPVISENEVAFNKAGGIRLSATTAGTLVQGNRVEANSQSSSTGYGIRLSEAAVATIDSGNVITANKYGIYVVGTGNPADAQPAPLVNGNSIYANLSGSTKQNFVTSGFTTPSATTLDLTSNWWGVASPTQTTAGIVIGSVGSGVAPIPNFGSALAAPSTNVLAGELLAKIGTVNSRNKVFLPDLAANPVPVATISFNVYDSTASIVVRICAELAAACNATTAVYSSSAQTFAVGSQSVSWNGTDSAGNVVVPEAYVYALEATKGGFTQVIDPPGVAAYANENGTASYSTTFDTYRNQPFQMTFTMLSDFRPGRVFFDIRPTNADGSVKESQQFSVGPDGYPNGRALPATPSGGTAISRVVIWNGRNPAGEVVDGEAQIFARALPMRHNVIVVEGSSAALTSPGGAVNIVADPYLVYDTFEQATSFQFKVSRLADVTITLLPPNSWSDVSAPAWQLDNVAANTTTSFDFRGHKNVGMVGATADEARELLATLAQEGAFTFRIRAEDETSHAISDAFVTVQIRH